MWGQLIEAEARRSARSSTITNGVHLLTWIGPEMPSCCTKGPSASGVRGPSARVKPTSPASVATDRRRRPVAGARPIQKRRLVAMLRDRVMQQLARHGQSPDELRLLDHLLDPDVSC